MTNASAKAHTQYRTLEFTDEGDIRFPLPTYSAFLDREGWAAFAQTLDYEGISILQPWEAEVVEEWHRVGLTDHEILTSLDLTIDR